MRCARDEVFKLEKSGKLDGFGRSPGTMSPNRPLSPGVKARCRSFRNQSTEAEKQLWAYLHNRQLDGIKFRRQHPVGNYVLDFYCPEANLCIEVDGSGHLDPEQIQHDLERTRFLQEQGIRIIRFWNTDIFDHMDVVLDVIAKEVLLNKKPTDPH
jgi:very-short-patch-repair endonuclease